MRVDVYHFIHKAQREHLFKLSIKIAKTDFDNTSDVVHLKNEIDEIITHLIKHAENEETFVHPFYQQFPDQCQLLESQHIKLEQDLVALKTLLNSDDFQKEIYHLFNRFVACYLLHIDEEERIQREILWQYFSDAELSQIFTRFQKNLTFEENMQNLEFMLPSLNIHELNGILKSMQNSAPAMVLEKVQGIIANLEWSKHDYKSVGKPENGNAKPH